MSNSSYAKALDSAHFRLTLATFPSIFRCGGWVPLAAMHFHFIREISMLLTYEVRTSIGAWDGKWIWYVCRFVKPPSKKSTTTKNSTIENGIASGLAIASGVAATAGSATQGESGEALIPPLKTPATPLPASGVATPAINGINNENGSAQPDAVSCALLERGARVTEDNGVLLYNVCFEPGFLGWVGLYWGGGRLGLNPVVRLFGCKYGIRVNLDLHAAPGYNHSGKRGQVNFLNSVMGIANAQRMLDYIRIIAEFISQPEYKDIVQMFGSNVHHRVTPSQHFALETIFTSTTSSATSRATAPANEPYIGLHDGFGGISSWAGFLPGSDCVIRDTHPYFSLSREPNDDPIATGEDTDSAGGSWPAKACNSWGPGTNGSRSDFGVTVAGEFSSGYNDCGLYLNRVNGSTSYGWVMPFALAQIDTLGDWFFWTWKIGNTTDGVVRAPLWSYQLGLEGGWMPTDPRTANGKCAAIGTQGTPFDGTFNAWQTGGEGAGTIDPAAISSSASGRRRRCRTLTRA
ncbi:glycoside hydrolase superfamily [Mycena olivaceomarginata]|nr:glycoside hydrolase superfamily [Mycena olivaceomarginata]